MSQTIDCPFIAVPYVAVHPDKINLYTRIEYVKGKRKKDRLLNLRSIPNKHNGLISVNARRKVSKAIEYLIYLSRDKQLPDSFHGKGFMFKLAFITLTLPSKQIHTDIEIRDKCLNQFLIEAKRKWNISHYIWKSEKQKNGNIHFHLIVNKFVPWSELRDCWNRIINKLSYVENYRRNMRDWHSDGFAIRKELLSFWNEQSQIKAYQVGKANDWQSPNSTDVHSLRAIINIKDYFLKYMLKEYQNQGIEGRLWGCSQSLSDIKGAQLAADFQIRDEIDKLAKSGKFRVYQSDHFSVIYADVNAIYNEGCFLLFRMFSQFMFENFNVDIQSSFS